MQSHGGIQCNPQCPPDSDDDPGWPALSHVQGGNCQWDSTSSDAEFRLREC